MEAINGSVETLIDKLKQCNNDLDAQFQISLALEPMLPQLNGTQLCEFFVRGAEGYRPVIFEHLKSHLSELSAPQLIQLLHCQSEPQREVTIPYLLSQYATSVELFYSRLGPIRCQAIN
jgi:hypothetical protein